MMSSIGMSPSSGGSQRDLATLKIEPLPGLRDTSLTWPSGPRLLFAAPWGLGPLQRQAAWRHGGKGASSGQVPRAVSSRCSNTQAIQLECLSIALQIHTHPQWGPGPRAGPAQPHRPLEALLTPSLTSSIINYQ